MRLVEQVTLVFTRGRSEKVYEIDLCAVGDDRFVVNYRYGRRGKPLKEGTQTVQPVPEARARAAFRKLIEQKQAQGYVGGPSFAPAPEPAPAPSPAPPSAASPSAASSSAAPPSRSAPRVSDPRAQATLDRLARGDRPRAGGSRAPAPEVRSNRAARSRREIQAALRAQRRGRSGRRTPRTRSGDGSWSLTRAMWRAGELRLSEATSLLVGLIGTGDAMRDYCAAWALARCGDASATGPLVRLYRDPGTPPHVARAAAAALGELFTGDQKAAFVDSLRRRLPEALRTDDAPALTDALRAHLAGAPGEDGEPTPFGSDDRKQWAALETLYLMNTPAARAAVEAVLPDIPLRPPAFQRVRAIFKVAELRLDARIFGLMAHRFATTRAMFDISRRGKAWVQRPDGSTRRVHDPSRALRSVDASLAYGSKTRDYLRRRTWRTLRRMGDLDSDDYVPMAVGVLLGYTDDDRNLFPSDRPFNRILYDRDRQSYQSWQRRSSRASRRNRRREREDTDRQEAFPHLWDRTPAGLMQLVDGSRCQPVHAFAARALRAQDRFLDALPAAGLAVIIGARYPVTAELGAELARTRYRRPGLPAVERRALAVAMAQSIVTDARRSGLSWLEREPQLLLDAPADLARLAGSGYDDVRSSMRNLLRGMRFDRDTARTLAGALIAHMMGSRGPDDVATATRLIALLDDFFTAAVAGLGEPVVVDLAGHPLAVVQSYAARLMADRTVPIAPSALSGLLSSTHAEVRVIALRILGLLDDTTLREATDLLWSSLTHRDGTIRDAARPIIKRLADHDPAFGAQILQMLIASLLRRRLPDGVPEFVVTVLREDFADGLKRVPAEVAWRLLRSKEGAAQELGGHLLPHHLDPATIGIDQLVELADHEVKSVREAAWQAMTLAVPRLKASLAEAVAVLDSQWEDTRLFAFDLFDTRFETGDFAGDDGATVLMSVCDSVRPDVQRFGRALIAKHFDPVHGRRYLLELSEHPSSDVQLFASNYLRDHAAGDPETLAKLAPYFIRVLCGVNRGRPAKKRAHAFLRGEALADRRSAEIVARIVTRQSATTAVEDRAECIRTMAAIHHRWPDVALPITVAAPPVRGGSADAGRGA